MAMNFMNTKNLDKYDTDKWKESDRGIAAMVVAIAHAYTLFIYPHLGPEDLLGKILGIAAHQAVMIFFVVSGYLITISILNNIQKNKGRFNFAQYLISRLARIYPPLIFVIAVTIFFWAAIGFFHLHGFSPNLPFGIGDFESSRTVFILALSDIKNAVLMRNGMLDVNGPLWSLCIEWRIYIVAGVLALFITTSKIFIKVLFAILFGYVFKGLWDVNEHAMFYLLVWLLGSIFALAPSLHALLLVKYRAWVLMTLLMVVVAWGINNSSMFISGGNKFGFFENIFQLLICIIWSFFIIPDRPMRQSVLKRASIWLGHLSYSLYILHFPIMLFILSLSHSFIQGSLVRSVLFAAISLFLAIVFSRLCAKYFENKKYFEKVMQAILFKAEACFK
jgi:peptidoglycan/LPS O-acetylase OafA/YrhL